MRTPRKIEIPGEPSGDAHDAAPAGSETPAQKIARLEAELAMLKASDGSRAGPPSAVKVHRPDDPYAAQRVNKRADQVDPTTIGKPVLAIDGWVVPAFVPALPRKD